MHQQHYESGPATLLQIGSFVPDAANESVIHDMHEPLQSFLDHIVSPETGFAGMTISEDHRERRAIVLWRRMFGIFQGCSHWVDYLRGGEGFDPIPACPADFEAGARDVIITDRRVPLQPLCAWLGVQFLDCSVPQARGGVHWAKISRVEMGKELKLASWLPNSNVVSPDMVTLSDALSAYAQRSLPLKSDQRLMLLGDASPSGCPCLYHHPRGKLELHWQRPDYTVKPSNDFFMTAKI